MARYDKDYVAFNRSGLAHTYAKCFVCLFYSHSIVVLYIFYIKQQVTLDKMRFVTSLQLGASLTPKFAWPNLVKIKHLLLAY